VVDAVRPAVPIDAPLPDGLLVRRVESADLPAVTGLLADYNQYVSAPPVSLWVGNGISEESVRSRINRSGHVMWIAEMEGSAAGLIEAVDGVSGAADIVSGGRGLGIKCAHVMPQWRGRGVGTALLSAALIWANKRDVQMCSVDFEAFNPTARRFWLRYFSPVCFSVVRHIDRRTVPM